MAQIVKLRRSSVSGQKPTNSNLQLGELALNTTDGKVYMAVSGSLGPTVEELISTNTVNTGSIHLVGDITASIFTGSFKGDGTNLYNIPASGVTGLNLTRIADGNATASISNSSGLKINTNSEITGSLNVTDNVTASLFTGSFKGDGSQLYNIPASGVTGLNLTRIADGNATASISNSQGLKINTNTEITGSLIVSSGSAVFDASLQLTENSSLILNSGSNLYVYDGGIISGTFKGNGALLTDLPYATTASNNFFGDQTITGSVFITQNLTVLGSSSILYVTSSQLDIATNIIKVNASNPGVRYGGLAVIDSGSSPQVSGSFLFDSIKDEWIFVHQAIAGSPTTSSVFLLGPETFDNLGNETYLTQNRIPKGSGIEHLNDSNITDTGTKVSINSNTEITGTFTVTGTALVSGSSQINITGTDGYTTFSSSVKDRIDTVTGSITDLSSSVKDRIDTVTGSITFLSSSVKDRIDIVTGSITDLSSSIKDRIDIVTSSITFLSSSVKDRIDLVTSSITFLSSSVKDRIDLVTSSVTFLSSSVKDRIDVVTGSITFLSSSVKDRIDVVTGSITSLSSSVKDRIDIVTGSIDSLNSFTASYSTGSFTGSFKGDGSGLYNIPASGVTGLQLDKIVSGNASASINNTGFYVNRDVYVDGIITAKEIHTSIVTSSVLFESGSTIFGNTSDDTHQFTGSVKISGSLQSDSITGSFTGSFTGNASGLVNVPFHITGSDVDGNTYNKQFSKLQFDDSTGLNVSESVAGTAFISIGSHFRDIFVSGSTMLRATGSDAFEVIGQDGIGITTSITDTNSNGYIKELKINATSLSSSLNDRINIITGSVDSLNTFSSSVVLTSQTSSMTVLSASYAMTAAFALNAGGGGEGKTYIHNQTSASTTWTVTHNLGQRYPSIEVFDSSGYVVIPGDILAQSDNTLVVTFPSAQTGKVSVTVGGGLPYISASYIEYVLATDGDKPRWKGGIISGSQQLANLGYATTGSNTFNGNQIISGTTTIGIATMGSKCVTISSNQQIFNLGVFDGANFDYVVKNGTNMRAGLIMSAWNGSSAVYNESSTMDLGSTSGVTFTVSNTGALNANISSGTWTIEVLYRALGCGTTSPTSTNYFISNGFSAPNYCDGLFGSNNSVYGDFSDWLDVTRFYTNSSLTTPFNGDNKYYGNSTADYGTTLQIDSNGYVIGNYAC